MMIHHEYPNRARTRRRAGIALLGTATALLLLAAPAQAGNEFSDGFEDQLGRLAAVEVFRTGRALIYHAAVPDWHVRVVRPFHHRADRHRHHADRHRHRHDHRARGREHERCDVRVVEHVRRDRRGGVTRTIREERDCDGRGRRHSRRH